MDVLELTQRLIEFDTVTPKGSDCLDYIQVYVESLGFETTRLPFGEVDNLFARRGTAEPHIMFAGHVDVVPPGEGWTHSPFTGVVENDILWGRGAVDMKGAIGAFLAAIPYSQPKGSISLLLTSDEEGPAKEGVVKVLPWLVENNHVPTFALVGEPTSSERLADTIKNGRRGSISFDIETYGTQGHVAYPHLANNAASPLLALLGILTSTTLDEGTPDFDPSNLEVVKLNMPNNAYNVIPGVAYASVNIRYNTLHSFESLTNFIHDAARKVKEEFGETFVINPILSAEPFLSSSANWGNIVAKAVESETGLKPLMSTSGGTSDARFIQKICPVVELGLLNKTAHKVDEQVSLSDLKTLQKIYERIFLDQ